MESKTNFAAEPDVPELDAVVRILRDGRGEILKDWLDRVRDNRAIEAGQVLSDPLLLDHMPQLFDALIERLEINRPREDAEQLAAIHGFSRRVTGYDVVETVIELLMFRRSIWSQITAVDAPTSGVLVAMERIDGMVDRVVITSLKAFLDPAARMLSRQVEEVGSSADPATPVQPAGTPSEGRSDRE